MTEDDRKLIGRRLRQMREKQGRTPADIARIVGVSEAEIQKIETGRFSQEFLPILLSLLQVLEGSILKRWKRHKKGIGVDTVVVKQKER